MRKFMSPELHISDEWRGELKAIGLDSFNALMSSSQGKCVSYHTRGQTYRISLPGGEVVFLKRDALTRLKDVLTDLWYLSRPASPCIIERRALQRVGDLGIAVPQVIAWGQRRRAGLPWEGLIVTRELPGVPLHKFLDEQQERRDAALRAAGSVAGRLYAAGMSWADLAPKHFLIAGQTAGILDLARMRATRRFRSFYMAKQLRRFGIHLRRRGGSDDDVAVFLNAVDENYRKETGFSVQISR